MTYKTRDSPTVIQPWHDHPMLTTACRSTSRRNAPAAEVRGPASPAWQAIEGGDTRRGGAVPLCW